nr:squalene/phytoene synthase family protein [Deltaproteobacteria bacterium]
KPLPASATRPLARAVRDLLALADRYYRSSDRGISALPWRAAIAVRAARRIYAAIGDRIRANHCDVLAGRAMVPRNTKLVLALGAVARTLFSSPSRVGARVRIPSRILEVHDVPLV